MINDFDQFLSFLQEIQQELHAKEGVVESIRLHVHKLLQGLGGNHVNSAAIHARLDNMGRRWDHLQTLAMDRYMLGINTVATGLGVCKPLVAGIYVRNKVLCYHISFPVLHPI